MLWTEGAHFVVIPSALKEIYGKEANTIYAFLFSYSGLSSILVMIVARSKFGADYEMVFRFSGVLSLVALLILIVFFKEKAREP